MSVWTTTAAGGGGPYFFGGDVFVGGKLDALSLGGSGNGHLKFCEYEDRRTHTAHHVTPC